MGKYVGFYCSVDSCGNTFLFCLCFQASVLQALMHIFKIMLTYGPVGINEASCVREAEGIDKCLQNRVCSSHLLT